MPTTPAPLTSRLENRLKMRHFALLLALDRHRSVTRVAEALSLSQPTVTRALADIEDIFMTPLFVRTGRGLEPTPAGTLVIARARFAACDNDALRQELEGLQVGYQGRLRIGIIPYVSGPALDAVWGHLFGLRPRLALHAHEDTTLNLLAAVRQRTLDCAICRFTQDHTDDTLVQELLYHQQAHLVVSTPSADVLERHRSPDITQLRDMDWIFPPPDTPIRLLIDSTFAAAGQRAPVPLLEAYAIRTISQAMSNLPRGITILPHEVAQTIVASGAAKVMRQPLGWQLPPVGLAWLRDSPKSTVVSRLAGTLRLALSQAPGPG